MNCIRSILLFLSIFGASHFHTQSIDETLRNSGSMLQYLSDGDSIVYYQCHVTASPGSAESSMTSSVTITEKIVLKRTGDKISATHYCSSETMLPNRRFSGLKIREKSYWNFSRQRSFDLTANDIKLLVAIEKKGREAIEFDYAITKYTPNQLIIRQRKNFRQLVINGNYVLSALIGKNS